MPYRNWMANMGTPAKPPKKWKAIRQNRERAKLGEVALIHGQTDNRTDRGADGRHTAAIDTVSNILHFLAKHGHTEAEMRGILDTAIGHTLTEWEGREG